MKSKAYIHNEASVLYAQLSGLYASKGFFKDSNLAYERAKCNEAWAKYYEVIYECCKWVGNFKVNVKSVFSKKKAGSDEKKKVDPVKYGRIGKNLLSLVNFLVCWILGFGYKLTNVVVCIVSLVVGYTFLFHSKATDKIDLPDEFAYSLNNTIGPYDKFCEVVGHALSSVQTTVGILLIGFAGFVLANRVRSNY